MLEDAETQVKKADAAHVIERSALEATVQEMSDKHEQERRAAQRALKTAQVSRSGLNSNT